MTTPRDKPLSSILIKPAGPDCNLACEYCFYTHKSEMFPESKTHRMSRELLAVMVKQAFSQAGERIMFGWQGGEPSLMGLAFFKDAIALQSEHHGGRLIGNGLQTNGLLLDEDWARFLARSRFLVGLSLDGPEHVHDRYRRTRGGRGSWAAVRDRAKLLLDHGVEVNALVVLNDYSARFVEEIYEFHKELGLYHMQFIPCLEPDPAGSGKPAAFSLSPGPYGEALKKLFDLWLADFRDGLAVTTIRFFDSVFYGYVGLPPPECTLCPECGIYVVVEHNGDVYACDFYVDPEWKLGNLKDDLLIELLNSERQAEFGRRKARLAPECRTCRWLQSCRGGCPRERGFDADPGSNHFCAAYRAFFEHAHDRLSALAQKWKQERRDQIPEPAAAPIISPPGRNDPCPCGSGRKYKKCCGR